MGRHYLGLQREDGSWPLVVELPSAHATVPNDAGATDICQLAKARALGDALTRGQMADGMIPTVLPFDPGRAGRQWVNCTVAAIEALDALAAFAAEPAAR